MLKKLSILTMALASVLAVSCSKDNWPAQPDWSKIPDPSNPESDGLMHPAPCTNRITAHRGGATEAGSGVPDNSIASLRYAMSLGVYGSECDVYWTKDDNVIVAHANANCEVNGLAPYSHTLAEIRAAGKLANGEEIPTIEDFIKEVMVEGNCTRLIIDIKKINYPTSQPQYIVNAARRLCEIITEMGARHYVHFHCTGTNDNAMKSAWGYAQQAGIEIAMNSGKSAKDFGALGFNWINLSATGQMGPEAGGTGSRTLKEYVDAGIYVSVYNVDKQSGDGNAVYSDAAVDWYVKNYPYFKTLSTNYPAWLLGKLGNTAERYDGISSKDEFDLFLASVISDPSGSNFANAAGEVILKTDIVLDDYTPFAEWSGVFDGGGHSITINHKGDEQYLGFVKKLTGTIKNLTVKGNIEATNAAAAICLSAFASTAYDAEISNCRNEAVLTVTSPDGTEGTKYVGGFAARLYGTAKITGCTDAGKVNINTGSLVMYGSAFATNDGNGKIVLEGHRSSSDIDYAGTYNGGWNYVGGLAGKPMGEVSAAGGYMFEMKDCEYSGTYTIKSGAGKTRAGLLTGYSKPSFMFDGCTASGSLIAETDSDMILAGVVGAVEQKTVGVIQNCVFSGTVKASAASKNWLGGVFGRTYANADVTVDGCRTTKTAYVGAPGNVQAIGMIGANPAAETVTAIKNCKIAGTIGNGGTETVISESNIEEWMFKGTAAAGTVTLSGNGYNAE